MDDNQPPPLISISQDQASTIPPDSRPIRTSGETPASEPLYSTVIPRSQREVPPQPSAATIAIDKKPKFAARDQPPTKSSGDGGSTSNLRIRYLEQMVSRLDKEKKAMDDEFGRQRKKFMKEMMQAESENNTAKQLLAHHVKEIEELNTKIVRLQSSQSEMGGVWGLATGTHEVEALKRKLQETSHEQSVRIEQMKNDWLIEKKSLEAQIGQLKQENMTLQSLKKGTGRRDRSKSPIRGSSNRAENLTLPKETLKSCSPNSALNFSSEGSLESSMLEAAKESQLLRTVVVPLEEEIDMLKMQLHEAHGRLKIYEEIPVTSNTLSLLSKTNTAQSQVPVEDVSEKELLEKLLNQERTARHDLEMHSDGLRRQKTLLLDDIQQLKEQLQENQNELKSVRESHSALQSTWEQANLKFITSQDLLKSKLVDLQHKIKQDELDKEYKLHNVGSVSPRYPRSPEPSYNRTRSTSWSADVTNITTPGEDVSWGLVEQLQRLIVGLRKDLDNKNITVDEYRQQLERVQGQLMQEIEEKEKEMVAVKSDHDKIKAALFRERKQREEIRRQLVQEKETMKSRIDQFQSQETKLSQKLKKIKENFTEMKHTTQKDMASFGDERARIYGQLEQKKEEYDCLKSVHDVEITEYKQRLGRLEQLQSEAEMNVASTMDELSRVRDRENQTENKFRAQIAELSQLLAQSKTEKESLSDQLRALQNDLIAIQKVNNKLEKDCNSLKFSKSSLQEKSKTFIEEQLKNLEEMKKEKTRLEENEVNLLRQIAQLKQQLASSEANQKDFVQLSQTLQVRLAEIEETSSKNSNLFDSSTNKTDDNNDSDDLFT